MAVLTCEPSISAPAVVTEDEISTVSRDQRSLNLMSYAGRHVHWLYRLDLHQQWWELKYLVHIANSLFWTPNCGLLSTELPLTPHSCSVHAGTVLMFLGTVQILCKSFLQARADSELELKVCHLSSLRLLVLSTVQRFFWVRLHSGLFWGFFQYQKLISWLKCYCL